MKITLDKKRRITLYWMLAYSALIMFVPSYLINLSFSSGKFPGFLVGFFFLAAIIHIAFNKTLENKAIYLIEDPFSIAKDKKKLGTTTVWSLLISLSIIFWIMIFKCFS